MTETVLTRYLTTLVDAMEADYGVASSALYRAAGIAPLADGRIEEADAEALWVAAEKLSGDGLLGLRVGGRVRYSSYSTLGHLLVTAKTVGDSLRAACELAFYVGAAGQLEMEDRAGECAIVYKPLRPNWRAPHVRSEAVLLPMVRFARWASPGVVPKQVCLTRPIPRNPQAYADAFGAPVTFGAACHEVIWDAEALNQPMNDANPALNEMLRAHVEAEMPKRDSLHADVRAHLLAALAGGGDTSITAIARLMGMSERSLQRALSAEGAAFRDMLSDVRREEAGRLLRETKLPVADVAARLGYSEPAAFVRAFRRWFDASPNQWRKKPNG
ncbi:AraC family transcriptional regulator [Kordiimonas lacus]|uniref:Helix-turn-helix domain-containing protein n=1 Tax=Kordiimonas lacus TaxID=637679 RepID=A0A1G7BEM7_9PROT|nr:AraC family transcriptional regulator [Kordiimonas lacus]SDE25568.1 Helix-turn-helix domain-containing protein [Kordiimonas lacus]